MHMPYTVINGTIYLVTTGNPVNSCLTSIKVKIQHEPVIAPFSVQILKCLLKIF